jgi:hypothetical protein
MATALKEYEKLIASFGETDGLSISQMFGKACLKINGKAFIAQHLEAVIFKLSGTDHARAMALPGAMLWDPSGKGRPMKEWVALPTTASQHFESFANAALEYVTKA